MKALALDKPSYLEIAVRASSLPVRLSLLESRMVGGLRDEWQAMQRQLAVLSGPACFQRQDLARELLGRLNQLEALVA